MLVVSIVVSAGILEVGTRYAFSHVSRIEQRIHAEHSAATAIRPVDGKLSVLLVGNSLPLEAVDMRLLQQMLPTNVRATRFLIESTRILDWKYGLRRLFADGSRPDVIVLSVGVENMLPTAIRGEYSAFYLFRTSDIAEIADTLDYSLTQQTNLYVARFSMFYAGRNGLRNFVLNRVDAPYGMLLHALENVSQHRTDTRAIEGATRGRLGDLRALCEINGTLLITLIPPGFAPEAEAAVLRGAAAARVTVLDPVPQNSWSDAMFRDGFHLNEIGANRFTRELAPQLTAILSKIAVR